MKARIYTLALSLLAACAIAGCRLCSQLDFHDSGQTNQTAVVSGFADETYVWESFEFMTNRVDGAK